MQMRLGREQRSGASADHDENHVGLASFELCDLLRSGVGSDPEKSER